MCVENEIDDRSGNLLEQARSGYLADLKRRRYSKKTVQTYGMPLKDFISFLAAREIHTPQDVSADQVEAYRLHLIERRLAPASQDLFLRAVRNLFGWLEATGALFLNPCRELVIHKRPSHLPIVPSEADIRRLLAAPNTATPKGCRDRALLEVAYSTGARRDELCRMTIFSADLPAAQIRIQGKGKKERMLPLGKHAVHWLEHYLTHARPKLVAGRIDEEALWLGNGGKPQGGQAMNLQVKTHARAAGIEMRITLHALRRACATHMLSHGAHPVQIQMLLGHATLKHLSQYLRLSITEIKAMHAKTKVGK